MPRHSSLVIQEASITFTRQLSIHAYFSVALHKYNWFNANIVYLTILITILLSIARVIQRQTFAEIDENSLGFSINFVNICSMKNLMIYVRTTLKNSGANHPPSIENKDEYVN